ncbi:MAG: hypothetical protein JXR48_18090 [Candidatus Delongbacteria bacterium]|nr:hypothetical protein [Candidatus Delongbacteria bacterium]
MHQITGMITDKRFYIKKYQTISQSEQIIDYLFELSKYIDNVNSYSKLALNSGKDLNAKRSYINTTKKYKNLSRSYLANIFTRIETLQTFEEYENIDFSQNFQPYDDKVMEQHFKTLYLIKQGAELIEKPATNNK